MNLKTLGKTTLFCSAMIGLVAHAEQERGIKRLVEPEYPDLELPQAPSHEEQILPIVPVPQEQKQLSTTESIFVKKIVLLNNTVLSNEEIQRVVLPYENRVVTSIELHQIRHELSRLYFSHGYISSGAIIPDQQIVDGTIKLRAIEGRLTRIDLSGNVRLREKYIKDRIAVRAHAPLNVNELQQLLMLLQRNPLINQVNAQLLPGEQIGETILKIRIKENKPYQLAIGVDNQRSPGVGAERGYLSGIHRNLTGRADTLGTEIGLTEGVSDFLMSYGLPFNRYDSTLEVSYSKTDSNVVEPPFDEIDIESKTNVYEISLSHPFIRTTRLAFIGSLGLEKRHSESSLLGIPFSFSPGVQDGESDVSAARLGLDWIRQSRNNVFALRGDLRIGVDALGATINQSGPDGKFVSGQAQIQLIQRINKIRSQIRFRSTAQITADPLLPLEKFAIGGLNSVRGYRENQFVRDNGIVASLEMRIPVGFLDNKERGPSHFVISPFADYGRSWDKDNSLPTSHAEEIYSVGLGMLWDPSRRFHSELFWGYALNDVNNPDNDLQDDGIHFRLQYNFL